MSKTFTVQVPDQIWFNSWDTNKIESYTYLGPDTLYVRINDKTKHILGWSLEPIEISTSLNDFIIELDATDSDNISIAHFLYSQGAEHIYIYEDEINHDGSTYQKITNPTIHDYFELKCNRSNSLYLDPIYKNTKTIAEEKAEKRFQYVKKYLDVYDFDAEVQEIIDKFLVDMNKYMITMTTVYPWKYVTIDENEIPKIPASLVTFFNTLPEIE